MVSFLYGKMANVIVNFFFEKDTFAVKAHRNCRLRLCSESYSSGVSESHSKSVFCSQFPFISHSFLQCCQNEVHFRPYSVHAIPYKKTTCEIIATVFPASTTSHDRHDLECLAA